MSLLLVCLEAEIFWMIQKVALEGELVFLIQELSNSDTAHSQQNVF